MPRTGTDGRGGIRIGAPLRQWLDYRRTEPRGLARQIGSTSTEVEQWAKNLGRWLRDECSPSHVKFQLLIAALGLADERAFFLGPDSSGSKALRLHDALLRLEGCREVFVLSPIDFSEFEAADVMAALTRCVDGGTRFSFIYSAPLEHHPDEPLTAVSCQSFDRLRRAFRARRGVDLDDPVDDLRGLMCDPRLLKPGIEDPLLFGFDESWAQIIAFRSSTLRSKDEVPLGWTPILEVDAVEAWKRIAFSIIPVRDAAVATTPVPKFAGPTDRRLLTDDEYMACFKELRGCTPAPQPLQVAMGALAERLRRRFRPGHSLQILEVGPADYATSFHLFFRRLLQRDRSVPVHVTGLESADGVPMSEDLGAGFHPVTCHQPLEEWHPRERYDCVLAFHSLYTVPPAELWRLLMTLRPKAELAILVAAARGNPFGSMARVIDEAIAAETERREPSSVPAAYPGKVVASDPYRVYAEDLLGWMATDGGACGLDSSEDRVESEVALSRLVGDGDRLTPVGRCAAKFLVGKPFEDDWHERFLDGPAAALITDRFRRDFGDDFASPVSVTEYLITISHTADADSPIRAQRFLSARRS